MCDTAKKCLKEEHKGGQGGNFSGLYRKHLQVKDCSGVSSKIPNWKCNHQAMKDSITGQGEIGVCPSAVLRCSAWGWCKDDLEAEDEVA